jgi:hypothetical protein
VLYDVTEHPKSILREPQVQDLQNRLEIQTRIPKLETEKDKEKNTEKM